MIPALRRDVSLSLLVLVQLAYSWMFSQVSVPNERTRAYLTIAIVEQGSVAIDQPVRRFGKVFDLAEFGGHYFTDKAPGSSLLAVPIYAIARALSPAPTFDAVSVIDLIRTWLMLPIGVLAFWLLRSLLRAFALSEPVIDVVSLGFSLGSSMLHYGGAFYGHAIVAACLLGCLRALLAAGVFDRARRCERRVLSLMAAGACAGLAGLTEYQAIPLSALLGLPVVMSGRTSRLRDTLLFLAGGAPFALALLRYDQLAFGGMFSLSYQHLVGAGLQALHGEGLMGATRPQWDALVGLLVSQHRGLVTTSPLLGLGLGSLALGPRDMPRSLFVVIALSGLYMLSIVSSSSVWFGGWSFGPRLLVPIMGLLAIAAAFWMERLRDQPLAQVLFRAAVVFGLVYQQAVHATFPELPPEFTSPVRDALLPLWQARALAPNLVCKWSSLAPSNLAPLVAFVAVTAVFVAVRGLLGRVAWSLASLACAAFALGLLFVPTPIAAREREALVRRVHHWQQAETRCLH